MKSLSQHYSVPILIELYSTGEVYKTSIQKKVVKTLSTLDKVLEELRNDGLIIIENKVERGNDVFRVSLTPKGRIVADNLMHLEEPRVTIPEGLITEIDKIIKRDKSHSSVEEYVKEAVRKAIEKWKRDHAVG
jgi:DNA-binding PadR family transcriptional regulator